MPIAARLIALVVLFLSLSAVADDVKPNVLFIAVDDLKPAIGAFGDEHAVTPNLDRLAARGTAFTNAHCQVAVCAPSRASLMLGLRPDATRVWDLETKFRDAQPDAVTLPQCFKLAGYQAIGMGKLYDDRSTDSRSAMDKVSWSTPYVRVHAEARTTLGYLNPEVVAKVQAARAEVGGRRGNRDQLIEKAFPDGRPITDRADVPDDAYIDGAIAVEAVKRLKGFAESKEPFFLGVGFFKPHLPFNAPEKYWQLYDRDKLPLAEVTKAPEGAPAYATQPGWELRSGYNAPRTGAIALEMQRELVHGYYAATSYIDAQIGKLLDELDRAGLADNTIVVVWGDHGWHLGDHGMWCKHTNYEQATRAPLIIAAPGSRTAGSFKSGKSEAPVEFIDIYPTLIDLARIDEQTPLHGTSLRPILEDPAASVKPIAISQFKRDGGNDMKMGYAYRSDRYRLVQWRKMNTYRGEFDGPVVATELYDYQEDPLETRNLADDPAYADARAEMEALAAEAFAENRKIAEAVGE